MVLENSATPWTQWITLTCIFSCFSLFCEGIHFCVRNLERIPSNYSMLIIHFKVGWRKYGKDEIFHWLFNNKRSFMESLWKNEGHKSTSKTCVLVHAKSSVMRQKRVEQQRGFEQHLGEFAYLSIPFSIELENVPEIENWRAVSSFWNSFQPFLLPFSRSLYFLLPSHKESESPCYCHHSLCPWSFNNKLTRQEHLFPTRNKVGKCFVCFYSARCPLRFHRERWIWGIARKCNWGLSKIHIQVHYGDYAILNPKISMPGNFLEASLWTKVVNWKNEGNP